MVKIAVYGQFYQKQSEASLKKLIEVLRQNKTKIFIERHYSDSISKHSNVLSKNKIIQFFDVLNKSFDLLISIGGDGTILRAITLVKDLNIPVVGINTGRLGFLATIQKENISNSINAIFNNQYTISQRSLLSVKTSPLHKSLTPLDFALNEIAVSRKNTTSMIRVKTKLNGEYLTSYWSDGLIVSTPTGSTGYSLSCGGPVITPNANNLVLTPIAPHNLNARPLVIPDSTQIELEVSGREKKFLISLDSRIATLDNSTIITIKKAPFTVKFIELEQKTFLDTLRKKLLWGEDKRN